MDNFAERPGKSFGNCVAAKRWYWKKAIDCSKCEIKEEYIVVISDSQKVTAEDLQPFLKPDPVGYNLKEDIPSIDFSQAEYLLKETREIFKSGDYINAINPVKHKRNS